MRKGILLQKALPIMQAVLLDPTQRDRLDELDLPIQVRVYMAVTVMLIHPHEFLEPDNITLEPLNATLIALAGTKGTTYGRDKLSAYCRSARLYQAERAPRKKQGTAWRVKLTPPPELLNLVESIEPWRMSKTPRYTLSELLEMIDEPNRSICQRFITENHDRFMAVAGSTRIHQAWQGGYLDHVVEVMNFAVLHYNTLAPLNRFGRLPQEQRFTLSDALVVMFLHDLEKIWRSQLDANNQLVFEPNGRVAVVSGLEAKADRIAFAAEIIAKYGFVLTAAMENALQYVEGIRDKDYTPDDPLMWPLAALCHMCDLTSARVFRFHPLESNETWGSRGAM